MIMKSSLRLQQGFTLIEIMVVIVIMTVMASLVVLNIGGIDQRKAMQARELFILDLKRINKESADQSKVFALNFQNATDVSPFTYNLFEYHDQSLQLVQQADKTWIRHKDYRFLSTSASRFGRSYENVSRCDKRHSVSFLP